MMVRRLTRLCVWYSHLCRDELLTELATLESNGKDHRTAVQSSRRQQQQRQESNGGANESTGDYETDGDIEAVGNVNASMLSEDLRLLAALN